MEENKAQSSQSTPPPSAPSNNRNFSVRFNKKRFTIIASVVLLAIAIPATIFLSQQVQDNRQQASSSCKEITPVDVMLVVDTSNSMQGSNLAQAKAAAKKFAATVLPNPTGPNINRIGIASFDNNGGLNMTLQESRNSINSVIDSFKTPGNGNGGTCLECALDKKGDGDVLGAFANNSKPKNKRHIVILTDGKINRYINGKGKVEGSTKGPDEKKARDQALGAMNKIMAANPDASVFIVQYGGNENAAWLNQMRRNQGSVQSDVNGESMDKMYQDIANQLMGGTVVAVVHNDANGNGTLDAGELPIANVPVKLEYVDNSAPAENKVTNGEGKATFSSRCDKPQTLTVTPLPNYEMSPINSGVRTVPNVPEGGSIDVPFLLKKQVNATSMVCDPTDITVSGEVQTMKATLKDKDGNPLANKTIMWNTKDNSIYILPQVVGVPGPTAPSTPAVTASPQVNASQVSDSPEIAANDESLLDKASSMIVRQAYAACSGNKDCGGGKPFCIRKSCEECRNPGQRNDCNPGRICNQNNKCVPEPTAVPPPATATAIPPTAAPSVVSPSPSVSPSVPVTVSPSVTVTVSPPPAGTVVGMTDANGVATISFKKSDTATGNFESAITAQFAAEGIYTAATCTSNAKYTAPAPELTLEANPPEVNPNETSVIKWTTKNVTECTASEGWTGSKNPQGGTETTAPITEETNYTLTCKGPGGELTKDVTVNIIPGPTITGGPSITEIPSITAAPGDTVLKLDVLLHGIGVSGDNVVLRPKECVRNDPNSSTPASGSACLSNQNPDHPTRPLEVQLYDTDNNLVKTAIGSMTYDGPLGGFKGTVNLGSNWTSGQYRIRVYTPMFLRRTLVNNHLIESGKTYTPPLFDMVSSDVNNDNKLSPIDWTMIVSCYAFPGFPVPCTTEEILVVDVDDDGDVDDFDTNLYRRDLTIQYGQ